MLKFSSRLLEKLSSKGFTEASHAGISKFQPKFLKNASFGYPQAKKKSVKPFKKDDQFSKRFPSSSQEGGSSKSRFLSWTWKWLHRNARRKVLKELTKRRDRKREALIGMISSTTAASAAYMRASIPVSEIKPSYALVANVPQFSCYFAKSKGKLTPLGEGIHALWPWRQVAYIVSLEPYEIHLPILMEPRGSMPKHLRLSLMLRYFVWNPNELIQPGTASKHHIFRFITTLHAYTVRFIYQNYFSYHNNVAAAAAGEANESSIFFGTNLKFDLQTALIGTTFFGCRIYSADLVGWRFTSLEEHVEALKQMKNAIDADITVNPRGIESAYSGGPIDSSRYQYYLWASEYHPEILVKNEERGEKGSENINHQISINSDSKSNNDENTMINKTLNDHDLKDTNHHRHYQHQTYRKYPAKPKSKQWHPIYQQQQNHRPHQHEPSESEDDINAEDRRSRATHRIPNDKSGSSQGEMTL